MFGWDECGEYGDANCVRCGRYWEWVLDVDICQCCRNFDTWRIRRRWSLVVKSQLNRWIEETKDYMRSKHVVKLGWRTLDNLHDGRHLLDSLYEGVSISPAHGLGSGLVAWSMESDGIWALPWACDSCGRRSPTSDCCGCEESEDGCLDMERHPSPHPELWCYKSCLDERH